jgi:hypothetical protein
MHKIFVGILFAATVGGCSAAPGSDSEPLDDTGVVEEAAVPACNTIVFSINEYGNTSAAALAAAKEKLNLKCSSSDNVNCVGDETTLTTTQVGWGAGWSGHGKDIVGTGDAREFRAKCKDRPAPKGGGKFADELLDVDDTALPTDDTVPEP